MSKNNIDKRIEELNKDLDPFYLVSHDDGMYSLCLYINGLKDDYGQAAFDAYAKEIGEPIRDEQGFYSYGSGYDWEAAFREAFKDDPNLKRIRFDCEAGGFFCDGFDLEMMADFGKRFKELCEDTERFIPIVSEGIRQEKYRQAEAERVSHTVRGHILQHPFAKFEIQTQQGNFKLKAGKGKKLLDGTLTGVTSKAGGVELTADEFLDQTVTASQRDLFDDNSYKLKAETEQEETLAPSLKL